jgi:carbamoyltransferase
LQEIILGISALYHDSAAAIIADGKIIAAAQEERFTRKKHDESFPVNAIQYVLQEAGITAEELTAVAFYDKPLLKFERLLETYHAFAPRGWRSFMKAIPLWLHGKIFMKRLLNKELKKLGAHGKPLFFPEHHLSHAASAFYPSPYEEAAILTVDGVGEWATTTIAHGKGKDITLLKELRFPHSPGLLYAAFTYFLGFKVNSGEYKMMGLAPYGDAAHPQTCRFREVITDHLVDIREDGSILLNMEYFDFATGMTMIVATKWEKLFGIPRRLPESEITEVHMNLALAIQQVTEAIVVKLAKTATSLVGSKKLVLAGGVALNCVANSRVAEAGNVESIWVQPAAGDAGGALGAALAVHHIALQRERSVETAPDGMQGAFLGPSYSNKEVDRVIRKYNAAATYYTDFNELTALVSDRLAEGKVVGWFQDRMEFGPRALGNRSILADPRNREMQQQLNLRVKFREGFRPFAPAIPEEDLPAYFDMKIASPYMLFVGSLKDEWKISPANKEGTLYERLYQQRSMFPAITHVDHSARVQVVAASQHPKFHQLISCFKQLTGCPMLVNTSFNVRGEPIVNTPEEAFLAFMKAGIDHLVIGNYLFEKTQQPVLPASVFSTFSAD